MTSGQIEARQERLEFMESRNDVGDMAAAANGICLWLSEIALQMARQNELLGGMVTNDGRLGVNVKDWTA